MQYRTLGRTELRVSEIGYGGGRVRPDQDEQALIQMLHHAFDMGAQLHRHSTDLRKRSERNRL